MAADRPFSNIDDMELKHNPLTGGLIIYTFQEARNKVCAFANQFFQSSLASVRAITSLSGKSELVAYSAQSSYSGCALTMAALRIPSDFHANFTVISNGNIQSNHAVRPVVRKMTAHAES